jgi:hypothetical protein
MMLSCPPLDIPAFWSIPVRMMDHRNNSKSEWGFVIKGKVIMLIVGIFVHLNFVRPGKNVHPAAPVIHSIGMRIVVLSVGRNQRYLRNSCGWYHQYLGSRGRRKPHNWPL